MPHATVFDTHAAVKRLQAAGVDEPQAEAIVDTLQGAVTSHVATKSDLDNLELRITIKLYAVAGGVIGLVVALVKALDFLIG